MNTDEVRDLLPDLTDSGLEVQLRETLDEIDRLVKAPLLSDNEFNETQIKREVEQGTKEACKEACRQKVEKQSSPDGLYLYEIEQIIDSAGGSDEHR